MVCFYFQQGIGPQETPKGNQKILNGEKYRKPWWLVVTARECRCLVLLGQPVTVLKEPWTVLPFAAPCCSPVLFWKRCWSSGECQPFPKEGWQTSVPLWGDHPFPPFSMSVCPMRSLHGANPSSSVSVACTPPWPLLVWSSGWGLKAWGKRHPCAPIACGLCSLFLPGEAEESRCLHRWSQHVWWCCSSQMPDCWPRRLSVWGTSRCTCKGMALYFITVMVPLPAVVPETLTPASWVSKQPWCFSEPQNKAARCFLT